MSVLAVERMGQPVPVGDQAAHRGGIAAGRIPQYGSEMSGGTWVGNQHFDDMNNIIDCTRNRGRTVNEWSLALDQNHNPHNGGCDVCTGLVTVHNGDHRHGDLHVERHTRRVTAQRRMSRR
ncbi:glycosyl hydrolase [Saccharopolyspora erythraea]|uniref:glycosyl hydrolase n=1 Tax=Saccharopolyspora erythraea TaxID=1836 RepID=UPI0012FF7D32|nr:glycosyl hydrolase [Saccharopolyspora erythraea]